MKLHLPFSLLSIILASSVYAVEIPSDYETEDLWVNVQLDEYMANEEVDKWAFVLWSDTTFTPSSNPEWTSSNPLVSGKSLIFTTSENSAPVKLCFTGGETTVFEQPSDLKFDTFSKLNISAQSATSHGGSINLETSGNLTIQHIDDGQQDTADLVFNNNKISASTNQHGGAIYANGADTEINISHNGGVQFSENSVANTSSSYSYGGAIYSTGNISIHYNTGIVQFSGNSVTSVRSTASGGGIYSTKSITINNNAEDINFTDNYASTQNSTTSGGAIYSSGNLTVCDNEKNVIFSGNHASSNKTESTYAYGGAIYSTNGINISNNGGNVCFEQNYAYSAKSESYTTSSGAYYPPIYYPTTTTHYYTSDAKGGAIYSTGSVIINNNDGHVTFRNNSTEASAASSAYHHAVGGAIYSTGSISIAGNSVVTFEKNYEKLGGAYRLGSIYLKPDSASDTLVLAARTRGHIAFYDSVYMAYYSGCSVSMNADYTDANGALQKATGDIIFSGKYTAEHLAEVKGSAGTSTEITNSQTSAINNLITLYGGSLQVVDGAKLNGQGLTVAADSHATLLLRDGSMSHSGYNFTFNATSALELQGLNTITATKLTMGSGTTMTVTLNEANLTTAALTLGGTDFATSLLAVHLNRTDGLRSGMYKIISQNSSSDFTTKAAWTEANVTVNGSGYASRAEFGDLVWENGTLYYKVGKNIWNNASGDRLWNTSSDNWTMNDHSYTYMDGMDVLFSDAGAGEVVLEGEIAPASIVVSNSEGCDYTFTAGDCSGRLIGASSIIKSGAGELTISTANEHTGNTDLQQGTINVHHSTALGATSEGVASLSAAAGTTLRVGNKSHLVLASSNNSLTGDVVVDDGSTLEMKGSGYSAATSSVNGTLAFTGTDGTIGTLSGNGMLEVKNSKVAVSTISDYKGSIILQGGRLELLSSLALKLRDGGMLSMSAIDGVAATLDARTVNVTTGTTLSVQDILGNNGAAPGEVETSDFLNSTVGGSMEISRLTLTYGSSLVMGNAHLALNGGSLTLAVPSSVNDKIHLDMVVDGLAISESGVLLFSEVESVSFIYDGSTVSSGTGVHYFAAVNYFVGYGLNASTRLVYDSNRNVVYLQGLEIIPEPATATLSLLALTALAARRRRKDA